MKAKLSISRALGNIGSLLLSLLVVECALQLLGAFYFDLDDLRHPGDARGFRNPAAANVATVVALGDSHTYGSGVDLEEAWPSVLSARLGADVYNMALPGYGAARNYANLPVALDLKPELVVFALYFGNDFYEDFRFALENDQLADYASPRQLAQILELESKKNIADEVRYLFRRREPGPRALAWLSQHSKVYDLLSAWKQYILSNSEFEAMLSRNFYKAKQAITDQQSPFVSVYEDSQWKTLLTAPYRLRVMQDDDPRINIGTLISKHMIEEMHAQVTGAGTKYLVLLVPTKECVFWPRVQNPSEHKMLSELIRNEERIRTDMIRHLESRNIAFVDLAPVLRSCEQQPYFEDGDGHPNAVGHDRIAQAVMAFIERQDESGAIVARRRGSAGGA
jgi:lysophospholipase L1-like esterase